MATAHESLGSIFSAQENYPKALEEYGKYLELSPDVRRRGYAQLQYGETLWLLGRYPEAAAAFTQAEDSAQKFTSLHLSILESRAEMLLSQDRAQDAIGLARQALALSGATGQGLLSAAELRGILGRAEVALGNKKDGLLLCQQALAAIARFDNVAALLSAKLALAQAQIETGNSTEAMRTLQGSEGLLTDHPESRWRAFALMAHTDRGYLSSARAALEKLRQQWGDPAYHSYLTRADVQRLSRPLLTSNSANSQ